MSLSSWWQRLKREDEASLREDFPAVADAIDREKAARDAWHKAQIESWRFQARIKLDELIRKAAAADLAAAQRLARWRFLRHMSVRHLKAGWRAP